MDAQRLAWIGLVITFLSWFFPRSIISSNYAALRDWFSSKIRKKLKERIAYLQERLKQSEQEWTYTPAEFEIFRAAHAGNMGKLVSRGRSTCSSSWCRYCSIQA
jgi:hypothetical protein